MEMMMAVFAKSVLTVSKNTVNREESDSDLVVMAAQYDKLMTTMAPRSLEIVVTVVTEIVDIEIFQLDCTMLWAKVFSSQTAIMGAGAATKLLEFEHHIHAQYQSLFQEPMGLPPAQNDGSFWICMIPAINPHHMSLY
jgi:hypothetical protein